MILSDLYRDAVGIGISADPREKVDIEAFLKSNEKAFEKMSDSEKIIFDQNSLWNPYSDTRIISGDVNQNIGKVIVGIDIDTSELLLIDKLNERGAGIDLVISHHPSAEALASLAQVMGLQADIFYNQGISMSVAEGVLSKRQKQVTRSVSSGNFLKTKMAAEHLGINLMCIHTPADSMAYSFLEKQIETTDPDTLEDLKAILLNIPEYVQYATVGCPPRIINGSPSSRVKKVHFEFTGGTEGPVEIYDSLAAQGVDTIIAMHQSDKHFEAASKANINVVLAGHMASDNLGLNLLLDELLKKDNFEIEACSGFIRVTR